MKAISYLRVSTDNQKDGGTIEIQQIKIKEFIKRNNHELIEEFVDEGVSGGLKDRPGLKEMLDYLQSSDADCVIIYKLDRLARDLYIQEGLIQEINRMGKKVISTLELNLDGNDPFRKAFRQMLGVFSEFEKSMIALRMEGGRERKARQGGWHGGNILGYKNEDGKLIVNEKEADIIRTIFCLKQKRKSLKSIAENLNELGYATKRGNMNWQPSSIRKILHNPIYKTGKIRYKGFTFNSDTKPILYG